MTEVHQTFDWLNPVATMVAAFAGSFFAFALEQRRRRFEEVRNQLSVARRAIYALSQMQSFVLQYRKEIGNLYEGKVDAWLNMPVSNISNWRTVKFDDALSFLLDTSEANVYAEVELERDRYDDFRSLLLKRDELLMDVVFPALGSKVQHGKPIEKELFEELLGYTVEPQLKALTNAILDRSASLEKTLVLAHDKLRDALAKIHPERAMLKFVEDPDEG